MGLGLVGLVSSACVQNKTEPRAEAAHGLPPLDPSAAPIAPSAMPRAEHAPVDPSAAALPPGHPHVAADAKKEDAALEQMSPGEIPFDKSTVIAGTLKLDGKLKDKVKPGDTIFMVVRGQAPGGAPGPVLAVRKLEAASFPMPFQIDSRDAMVAGTQLKAPVVLSVRVDKDGDAMSKNPGDVTGTTTVSSLPSSKLALTLDKVL